MALGTRASAAWWRKNLLQESEALKVAKSAKRVAVLGIKTERQDNQPAYYVPRYLQSAGVEIIPVPVYFPDVKEILGQAVYRKLADIPSPPVDIVDVFRRPKDLEQHLEDILLAKPKAVWLQSGISLLSFEEKLAQNGIKGTFGWTCYDGVV